jgi:hypothetical protein
MPGTAQNTDILGHFTVTADVMPNLGPKLLLGTQFLYDHGVKVDFVRPRAVFRAVHNMTVPAQIFRNAKSVPKRKIVLANAVTILPSKSAIIPVHWKELPQGIDTQNYYAETTSPYFPDALLDNNSSKNLIAFNNSAKPIKLKKGYKVGYLLPANDTGNMEKIDNINQYSAYFAQDIIGSSIESSQEKMEDLGEPNPAEVDSGIPSYGITCPDEIPYMLNKFGVKIANIDPEAAKRLILLSDKFDIYRERGVVPVPEDMKMRIDLAEGWQNRLKPIRKYAAGIKDRQVLDQLHDELHVSGKMSWLDLPAALAAPAFVVWRVVKGIRKGRVVYDMRPINAETIRDIYPLPDQSDIMNDTRGKKIFSMFDGTGFFYQLPIYGPHRNRMVVISDRGLEASNVALQGFKNAPAYAQRYMERLFRKHRKLVRVYIDDIIVFSDNLEDHLDHLQIVLNILEKNRVKIAAKKSFIGYPAVQLLGFVVNSEGITNTSDRIKCFQEIEFPNNLGSLETFIGMAGFLRNGIPWFDTRIRPLQRRKTQLLREARENNEKLTGLSKPVRKKKTQQKSYSPTKEETQAFKTIKSLLSEKLMLWHHDPIKPLFLKVDACKEGFGLFTFQLEIEWDGVSIPGKDIPSTKLRPILFLSRATSNVEQRYGSTEAEVAAIAWSVRKLRKMIQSNQQTVNIITDHSPAKGIIEHTSLATMDLDKANLKLAKIANYLSQFDLKVFHIPGVLNVVPDALSRLPVKLSYREKAVKSDFDELENTAFNTSEVAISAVISDEFREEIKSTYPRDPKLKRIIESIENFRRKQTTRGQTRRPSIPLHGWDLRDDGLLYYVGHNGFRRLCIPSPLVKTILEKVHDDRHHFGIVRMAAELQAVSFPRMSNQIREYVAHCAVCRENAIDRSKPPGELRSIKVEPTPFHTISLDFITDLPEISSENTIWAIPHHDKLDTLCPVNCIFTKRTILLAGHTTYTAENWAIILIKWLYLCDWGLPRQIISDRDPKFVSKVWQSIFSFIKVKFLMATAYHAPTNGLSERKNQTVEVAIRYHTATDPETTWVEILPALQHHLNNADTATIGRSPNELLYGFRPNSIVDLISPEAINDTGDENTDIASLRKLYWYEAQLAISMAAALSKIRYDNRHEPININEGDIVYLRLHKGYELPGKPKKKWSPTRAGPYRVLERINPLAFKLDLPTSSRIHPVVSAAHLWKPTQGPDPFDRLTPPPPPIALEGENSAEHYEIERIISYRVKIYKKKNRNPRVEFLVRWKGYTAKDDQWIAESNMRENASGMVDEYLQANPIDWNSEYEKRGLTNPKEHPPDISNDLEADLSL